MGNELRKVDLCQECAKTKGVNDPTGFSLAELLAGLAPGAIDTQGGSRPSIHN
jgi:protein arginine kinase activator